MMRSKFGTACLGHLGVGTCVLTLLASTTPSQGAVVLSIAETSVPSAAEVTLNLTANATAGETATYFLFYPKINDGSATTSNPSFTRVPDLANTQFAGGNADETVDGKIEDFPSWPGFGISIQNAVSVNGVLAQLKLNTSALTPGQSFTLALFDDPNTVPYFTSGSTRIDPSPSGPFQITIAVPEPAIAVVFAAAGLFALRRRRRS